MNDDQTKGRFDKLKGDMKEGLGKLSGNETMEAEGKADQAKGSVQGKYGDTKEKLADKFNDAVDRNR